MYNNCNSKLCNRDLSTFRKKVLNSCERLSVNTDTHTWQGWRNWVRKVHIRYPIFQYCFCTYLFFAPGRQGLIMGNSLFSLVYWIIAHKYRVKDINFWKGVIEKRITFHECNRKIGSVSTCSSSISTWKLIWRQTRVEGTFKNYIPPTYLVHQCV